MIIKRYDGSNFVELFPKTTTTRLFNNAGTTPIFDSNDKINLNFLPDAVFDSLYFYGTAGSGYPNLSHYIAEGINNSYITNRSILGYYWVVFNATTFNAQNNGTTVNINSGLINVTAGSNELTFSAGFNTNQLRVGMIVFGTSIPTNATITSIKNSTTFVISAPVTVALTSSPIIFRHVIKTIFSSAEENHTYTRVFTLEQGDDKVTAGSTAYLQVGMRVSGTGIPNNTTITEINANGTELTLSQEATEDGPQTLTFQPPFSETTLTQTLEPGDWFIVTNQTGAGIAIDPFVFTIAPVNNTYELMKAASSSSAGAPGLVPGPDKGQQAHFLRGDGTWVIPTNTTYSGSTSITLAAGNAFQRAALTGDVTANANNNSTTIANDVVTFAKMQNSAEAGLSVIGRSTSGVADFAEITGSDGQVLRRSGTTLGFGTIASAGIEDGAVTEDKIGAGAVTNAKIGAGAVGTDKIGNDAVTFAKLQNSASAGLSVIGRSSSGAADFAEITAEDGTVLRRSGTSLGFGTIASAGISNDAVGNNKLANMAKFTIKGNNTNATADPDDLTTEEFRVISNLSPILFGATLLDPVTSASLNTPVAKSNGMADGDKIPEGTIWYDTTVA
jgi:hypothetical protein